MSDHEVHAADGRTICFADYGRTSDIPVVWCHGGPGSRHEPAGALAQATDAGFRLIGIDRPGYGGSTPQPGRSIGDWPADALMVADCLHVHHFFIVGVSTGGAYALATAAAAPDRVRGVVACCALTDMCWGVDHAMLTGNAAEIWNCKDRDAAMTIAVADFGEDGGRMMQGDLGETLAPTDLALLSDPAVAARFADNTPFAQGVVGYADDRLADGPRYGWSSFDIRSVSAPVVVVHGEDDRIVPVAHAHNTAAVVPGSTLRTYADHGHLSIVAEVVPALRELALRD